MDHNVVSVSVIAKDCATADAIATAVMIKGQKEGLRWINSLPLIEGMLIVKNTDGKYAQIKSDFKTLIMIMSDYVSGLPATQ